MKNILIICVTFLLIVGCKTTEEPELESQSNLDFTCYNMCISTPGKKMKFLELQRFCKLQCPAGN